jgi:exonuclease VII small subunit
MAGEYEVEKAALRSIIRAMEQDIGKLESAISSIRGGAQVTTADLGSWPAASQLASVSQRAYTGTETYGRQLLEGYKNVLQRLRSSLQKYEQAEQLATTASNGPGSSL